MDETESGNVVPANGDVCDSARLYRESYVAYRDVMIGHGRRLVVLADHLSQVRTPSEP